MNNVVHTYYNVPKSETRNAALKLSIILAGDLGIASEVSTILGGHRVTADDGKSTDFLVWGV